MGGGAENIWVDNVVRIFLFIPNEKERRIFRDLSVSRILLNERRFCKKMPTTSSDPHTPDFLFDKLCDTDGSTLNGKPIFILSNVGPACDSTAIF